MSSTSLQQISHSYKISGQGVVTFSRESVIYSFQYVHPDPIPSALMPSLDQLKVYVFLHNSDEQNAVRYNTFKLDPNQITTSFAIVLRRD